MCDVVNPPTPCPVDPQNAPTTYTNHKPVLYLDGTFDGKSHVIKNFTYIDENKDYLGVVGYLYKGANIKNLGVENVFLVGNSYVGGLAQATKLFV